MDGMKAATKGAQWAACWVVLSAGTMDSTLAVQTVELSVAQRGTKPARLLAASWAAQLVGETERL